MATPLPPTDVSVSSEAPSEPGAPHTVKVKATRPGANAGSSKEWVGEGSSTSGAVADVVKKIFNDPITPEFM
jgi:hypothetical protein